MIDDETTAKRKLSYAGGYEQPHSVVHEMGRCDRMVKWHNYFCELSMASCVYIHTSD